MWSIVVDLDNDGYDEIVANTQIGMVYAIRYNGTLYWKLFQTPQPLQT